MTSVASSSKSPAPVAGGAAPGKKRKVSNKAQLVSQVLAMAKEHEAKGGVPKETVEREFAKLGCGMEDTLGVLNEALARNKVVVHCNMHGNMLFRLQTAEEQQIDLLKDLQKSFKTMDAQLQRLSAENAELRAAQGLALMAPASAPPTSAAAPGAAIAVASPARASGATANVGALGEKLDALTATVADLAVQVQRSQRVPLQI